MTRWTTLATIGAITVAIDLFISAFVPADFFDYWVKGIPIGKPALVLTPALHHDLRPNLDVQRGWGAAYRLRTDAFGLRTGDCAGNRTETAPAVFVVGDSFVEGPGLDFEQTFPAMIACQARRAGRVAYNLGVRSYSPIIYHRKVLEVARRLDVTPSEIVVFLDISDIQDDAEIYEEKGGEVHFQAGRPPMSLRYDVVDRAKWWEGRMPGMAEFGPAEGAGLGAFVRRNSMIGALLNRIYGSAREALVAPQPPSGPYELRRSMWTVDSRLMEEFGQRGLETAAANLGKLAELCRQWKCSLTLVVYPWPDQIARDDRDSIQIRYWQQWAARHDVHFIDAISPFFTRPASEALQELFIKGDVHFSERGNRLIFDTWWRATCTRWNSVCPRHGAGDGNG
jgi:hypothetical protein